MNPKSIILLLILTHGLCADEPKPFFPVSEEGGKDTISTFEHEWYLKHLRAMKEPSLFSKRGDKTQDIYRFTLLPTWGNPLSSVVTKSGDRATIQFTRLDGQGGYEPGKIAEKEQRDLTEEEIKDFLAKFDALNFADQSTNDPFIGLDGSEWILERLKDGEYHIVVRWTADAYEMLRLTDYTGCRAAGGSPSLGSRSVPFAAKGSGLRLEVETDGAGG